MNVIGADDVLLQATKGSSFLFSDVSRHYPAHPGNVSNHRFATRLCKHKYLRNTREETNFQDNSLDRERGLSAWMLAWSGCAGVTDG